MVPSVIQSVDSATVVPAPLVTSAKKPAILAILMRTVPSGVNATMAAMTLQGSVTVRQEEKGQTARIIVNEESLDLVASWTVSAKTEDFAMQKPDTAAA